MKHRIIIRAAVSSAAFLAGTIWLAVAAGTPTRFTAFDPQAKALVARMTLDEKIGQMTQPDQEHIRDLSDIENYFFGSILSGGNSDPKEGNSLEAKAFSGRQGCRPLRQARMPDATMRLLSPEET